MPDPLTAYLRLVCTGACWLCLLSTDDRENCAWWRWYLVAAGLVGITYFPELPNWSEVYWPALLVLGALRMAAALEAIHHLSKDFRYWSRLIAGSILAGVFYVSILWNLHDGSNLAVAVQLRRYLAVWTSAYCNAALLFLWSCGALRGRPKAHVLIVTALCARQAAVASAYVFGPFGEGVWQLVDQIATATDACLYLLAAVIPFSARNYRPSSRTSRARPLGDGDPFSVPQPVSPRPFDA